MGAKPTKPATTALTTHQWLYITVMNGVGAMILNGSLNCGLAYLTNLGVVDVSVWKFDPSPLAGDIGVTILIQQMLTWILAGALVCKDVRFGAVAPLASPPPRILKSWVGRAVVAEDLFKWEGLKGPNGLLGKLKRALPRALIFTVASFVLFWPVTVLILSLIYNARGRFSVVPDCLIIKLVFGGLMSWTTPFVAYFGLRTMGMEPIVTETGSPRVSITTEGSASGVDMTKTNIGFGSAATPSSMMLESSISANRTIV